MYKIDFQKPINVYFIGIGGISMSGFALLLKDINFNVTGSDIKHSEVTDMLEKAGISINYSQVSENISSDIDLIVYTAAISKDNPEYVKGNELNIPMMERAELVGQVMKNYKHAIGISGTHGKTTTTSMLSYVFMEAEKDPTISVGGLLDGIGGNIRIGHSDYFIAESCEYTNSFLKFHPTAEIILNVEADHLDFFKDLDDIRNSFKKFAEIIPEYGVLVINGEIENTAFFTDACKGKCITYGLNGDFDYTAKDIEFNENGCPSFVPVKNGEEMDRISLNVVGIHNVYNALSVIAMAEFFGIAYKSIAEGLGKYGGTHRRFEKKGQFNGVTVIDDYAHHPTEIEATLNAAKEYPKNKLWVVFQPHTYSRTKALFNDFARVLSKAENVVVADIYAAREKDPGDINSQMLSDAINASGGNSVYISGFDEIKKYFLKKCINGDLLITMGAGNVVDIGNELVEK
ncbi:MAG: UDP-N-acetylmuramate--L-alanine ligase [Lachnospiraceae bacterium]|nr:UDP-N-acetylmuramate--L-alanine ligase [Lachnospiraceae bacterium]